MSSKQLEDGAPNVGTISACSAVLLLLANGIGTGVLVLPKAMAAVGVIPMLTLITIGALISGFTTWILLLSVAKVMEDFERSQGPKLDGFLDTGRKSLAGPSYADLLRMVTLPCAAPFLDMVVVIETSGALVTFLLFLVDFLQEMSFWTLSSSMTILILTVAVYPATLLRRVGLLANLASLPLIALTFMAACIWLEAPVAASQRTSPVLAISDLSRSPSVLCICVYAFLWHNNVVALGRELENPTTTRCAGVAFGATLLLGIVYFVLALGGYWSWGDALNFSTSITDEYAKDDPLFIAVRVALIVSLLVSTPLQVFPVRESCIGLLRQVVPEHAPDAVGRAAWSFFILLAVSSTAIVFPHIVDIITILGGTLSCLMVVVFPVVISRLVFNTNVWLLSLVFGLLCGAFLNAAALGFLGSPVGSHV